MKNLVIKTTTIRNVDIYDVSFKTGLSTKEYAIEVHLRTRKVTGDVVAYGHVDDLTKKECMEILRLVKRNNKLIRPYEFL